MDLGLAGRTSLVTGGSRGIGREIALMLAREGSKVVVCGRDEDALRSVGSAIHDLGSECATVAADLSEPAGCSAVVEQTIEAFGQVHILVNSATAEILSWPESDEEVLLRRIWDKALPSIRCSRLVAPHMASLGEGRIIFIGGLSGRMPFTEFSAFTGLQPGASTLPQGLGNAVVSNYAKYLSDEVGKLGITVNVVHPSIVLTDRVRARLDRFAETTATSTENVIESLNVGVPIGRLPQAEEIAAAVVFLASKQAAAITGQSLAVDGGFSRMVQY